MHLHSYYVIVDTDPLCLALTKFVQKWYSSTETENFLASLAKNIFFYFLIWDSVILYISYHDYEKYSNKRSHLFLTALKPVARLNSPLLFRFHVVYSAGKL